MKSEKFVGDGIDQLEVGLDQIVSHALVPGSGDSHLFSFCLVHLDIAAIKCEPCKVDLLTGSRNFIESIWLEWSIKGSDV